MNLHDTWKKLEVERLGQPIPGQLHAGTISKHPLQKVKWVYRISIGCISAFLVSFVLLFFIFQEPLVKGSLILMILFYFIGLILNLIAYKKLKLNITLDKDVKSILEHTYASVSRNVQFQERLSIFIYPAAVVCGFFMGLATMSDNIHALVKEKSILIMLFVAMIILTPLCYVMAKHLHKRAYGQSLQELKQMIFELEKPE